MSNIFALPGQKKELEKFTVLGDFTLNKGKFVRYRDSQQPEVIQYIQ
jgi:hypothetical protein